MIGYFLLTMLSRAHTPAAASTPACLQPPPSTFLTLMALVTSSLEPTMTEPTGQPRPWSQEIQPPGSVVSGQLTLLRQMEAESHHCSSVDSGVLRHAEAFHIRAPSQ